MKFRLDRYQIKRNFTLILLLSIPVIILLLIYFPTNHFFSNQYDDTYITYRYAINFAEGHGIVFNIGELTDSASSFLYTIALAIFYKFGLTDLEFIGSLIGFISLEIVVVYVYKLAYHLTNNKSISLMVGIAAGLNGFLSGWALSGMETLPWTALIIVAIYLMIIDANYILISLTIAVASFSRFEGIFLIIPYIVVPAKFNFFHNFVR